MSVHHERILSTMLDAMEIGCPIVTAEGEQIGTLAEVAEETIKVDAPMRRDFWIDAEYVRSCDSGRIELSFLKQDLGAYKLSTYRSGDVATANDPLAEGKTDHIISDQEQLATRLRMEQELAEQRQDLPHMHPRGDEAPPDTFGTLGEPVETELSRFGVNAGEPSAPMSYEQQRGGVPYAKFLVVAAAVIPFVAAAWWMRSRRR